MKKILLCFTLFVCGYSFYAQQDSYNTPLINIDDFSDKFGALRSNKFANKIDGSPLLFSGTSNTLIIYTNDDKAYRVKNGNYNAFTGEIVTEFAKDSLFVFDKDNIKFAKLNNKVLKKYKDKSLETKFYFVLSEGQQITFLKGHYAVIENAKVNLLTDIVEENSKYAIDEKYYISKDNATVVEVKLRKSSILNEMKDHKDEVVTFVKENNLSYNKEEDLIKIMRYYNGL
ncbi:MAG: hypothetical protein KDD03_09810 [Gelidibacter sp.]|nr:hypothetical protein [Gelidibacter sp.]